MEDLLELVTLCGDVVSIKALRSDDIKSVQTLINHNLFKYDENATIINVDIYKLMIEKGFIDKTKIELDYDTPCEIMKYLIEELNFIMDKQKIKNLIYYFSVAKDYEKTLSYLITKYDLLTLFGRGSDSILYYALQQNTSNAIRILMKLYDNNEELEKDLTSDPCIGRVEIAQIFIEEFGYPYTKIRRENTSGDVDRYLDTKPQVKAKTYIAVKFDNKQDNIILPGVLELKRNNNYYYGYLIKHEDSTEQLKKYIDIMSGIGESKIYNV